MDKAAARSDTFNPRSIEVHQPVCEPTTTQAQALQLEKPTFLALHYAARALEHLTLDMAALAAPKCSGDINLEISRACKEFMALVESRHLRNLALTFRDLTGDPERGFQPVPMHGLLWTSLLKSIRPNGVQTLEVHCEVLFIPHILERMLSKQSRSLQCVQVAFNTLGQTVQFGDKDYGLVKDCEKLIPIALQLSAGRHLRLQLLR